MSLRNLSFPRYASTEPHRSGSADTFVPGISTPAADSQTMAVGTIPPVGHPPPSPPAPLGALPEKVAEVAKEGKEVAKKDTKPKGTMPQRVWATVKKEAAHYWAGTKLLGQEIKISAKLQWKVLNGSTLTRRERRQVSHSTSCDA